MRRKALSQRYWPPPRPRPPPPPPPRPPSPPPPPPPPPSNEELLLDYGFALLDNPHDTYGLTLDVRLPGTAKGVAEPTRLGPFQIRRNDPYGRWAQFPPVLWRALDDPVGFAEKYAGKGEGGGEEDEEEAVEIDSDDVQLLLVRRGLVTYQQVGTSGFSATNLAAPLPHRLTAPPHHHPTATKGEFEEETGSVQSDQGARPEVTGGRGRDRGQLEARVRMPLPRRPTDYSGRGR